MANLQYDIPDTQAPVRQGDLLFFPNVPGAQLWDQKAVVLTADCDLAWGASRGLVTIVPVITVHTYVQHVWAERKIRRLRATTVKLCHSMIVKQHKEKPEHDDISEDAVARWMWTSTADEICDAIGLTDVSQRDAFINHAAIFQLCERETTMPPSECMSILTKARAIASKNDIAIEFEKATKQAGNELQEVPQDVFYLASLPGVTDTDFYAVLRDLRHFPVNRITTSLEEAREKEGFAFRAARLKPVFKYSMSQQFALLFSRIGLPQEYTDDYKGSMSQMGSKVKSANA